MEDSSSDGIIVFSKINISCRSEHFDIIALYLKIGSDKLIVTPLHIYIVRELQVVITSDIVCSSNNYIVYSLYSVAKLVRPYIPKQSDTEDFFHGIKYSIDYSILQINQPFMSYHSIIFILK